MTKISKAQLIERVENLPYALSKASAKVIVEALFDAIRDEVEAGNTVALRGFGTFSPRHRAERVGRNPRTGEAVLIPASSSMCFKPSPTAKASDEV